MTNRDFKRALFEARAELARIEMPAPAASRVWQRIHRPSRRVPRVARWLAVATAGAGAMAALSAVHLHRARPAAALPDGFEVVAGVAPRWPVRAAGAGVVAAGEGPAMLRVRSWGRVTLHAGARLRRAPDGVELLDGAADFEVDKRQAGAGTTFVHVAQAAVEITGTRFSIETSPGGGAVRLDEGAIRFHAPDGRTVALAPGQSLRWPLPPEDAPTPPRAPAPVAVRRDQAVRAAVGGAIAARAGDDDASAEAVVDRIAALRAAGRYGELADELRLATARARRPVTRERLSFELGEVLSFHLADGARACAHWADHLRAFPAGHYADEVSDARRILGCDTKGDRR